MEQVLSLSSPRKYTFFQQLVYNLLSHFKRGRLILTLPDGTQKKFGDTDEMIVHLQVKNWIFFKKIVLSGDIGFGESYSDGDWQTDNLVNVIKWAILNMEHSPLMSGSKRKSYSVNLLNVVNRVGHILKRNNLEGSKKNISFHYDLSNDFYKLMLDPSMSYSAGIFANEQSSLEDSQYLKLQKLCEDLDLKSTDHVLEIGCGWGGFAEYAATHYGCKVTGITISKQQFTYAQERIKNAKLEDKVQILFQDYRLLEGEFDKIVSIEMIEAVGDEYLPLYFKKCHDLLKPEGLLVIQAITCPDSRYDAFKNGADWIQKHIFPGSLLPSIGAMNQATLKATTFHLYHLRDIGLHYAKTLRLWRENFFANLQDVKKLGFDDEFIRKWEYYLCYCEAAFAMRNISDVQLTYIKPNNTQSHLNCPDE